jgi:hypothetical protein
MKSANERSEPDGRRIHSFIVKIWREDAAQLDRWAIWRGQITHVPSNRRQYVTDLVDILIFIAPYLVAMGVRLSHWHYAALRVLKRAAAWCSRRRL